MVIAALTGAAAVSVRALTRPRSQAERRLMDWEAVRRTAHARCGESERLRPDVAARLAADCDRIAAELAPSMAEVCGSAPAGFPRFTVLDRRGFIDANLEIIQRLLEPAERLRAGIPESVATAVSRKLLSRYVGELFGFMSQRVLGQYDPVLMLPSPAITARPASALYLVESNVNAFQRSQDVPADDLRRWLILHELTHAWQFETHPWLAAHIGELLNELLMSSLVDQVSDRQRKVSSREVLRSLPGTVRGQLRGVGRLQAIMSVLEGYSNFVMHRVGRGHIGDFEQLESAFHKRKSQRSLLERLVLAITGINMKMRQYEVGERFADAVTAKGGYGLLNRVWEGPGMMPSMDELNHPERWLARVG
jgi:coenzyme F420 biosynthesis associated uncharacterized protein